MRLGEALDEADELGRAEAAFEEGVALVRDAGDGHAEWLGRVWLARVELMQDPEGALDRMLEEATAAVAAREPAHDHEVLAVARGNASPPFTRGAARRMRTWTRSNARSSTLATQAVPRSRARLAGMRAPDFIWGPGRVEEGVRYADELVERLGHVPGVQQFALHLHAHMQARLGEFEGALEAMSTYRDNLHEASGRSGRMRSLRTASGTSALGPATCSMAKERFARPTSC